MRIPPSDDVLQAFGAADDLHPLDGGQGQTWLTGTIVLKPAGMPEEVGWRATVLDALPEIDGLRIARPVQATSGEWVHDGWEAWHHLAGRTDPRRWNDAIPAGRIFHEAIAGVGRPEFLDRRNNWWSLADRAAWNMQSVEASPILRRLMQSRVPVTVDHQLVHGDLLGNVLYEPGLPPAIIDWAPYWRPVSWATAVGVVDALCWHGADQTLIQRWSGLPSWGQMLLRALLFRLLTDLEVSRHQEQDFQPHPAYFPVVNMVIAQAVGS